jgi:hypothetical protein
MELRVDTERLESLSLTFSDEDLQNELSTNIQNFCYGMAALYMDFVDKIGCDSERATSFKEVFFSCMGRDIDLFLRAGILEHLDEDEEKIPEECEELVERMREKGFTEEEIADAVQLVKTCGGLEEATGHLDKMIEDLENDSSENE